jgi:threonyl-tRNA synthetase
VLGKQLDLFSIQEVAGAGLIFWHPKGGIIRKIMEDWMRDECIRRGYSLVFTPHVMRRELWKISGHEGFYSENMYTPMELDDAEYRLKPMNCPGHILIYKNSPKSYRDLPVSATPSSATSTATSAPAPCTACCASAASRRTTPTSSAPPSRSKTRSSPASTSPKPCSRPSASRVQGRALHLGPEDRRPYAGSDENWALAVGSLEARLDRKGHPYKTIPGEAAFYGPKIDIKLVDVLGRLWQLSTVQFDFNLPARFELEYIGEDGERHQPVMVHRALFGSVERFFGVLIEHYAGAFPLWLAPVQVGLVPISERHHDYAKRSSRTRSRRPARRTRRPQRKDERQDPRLRQPEDPYILVMGDKEAEAPTPSASAPAAKATRDASGCSAVSPPATGSLDR